MKLRYLALLLGLGAIMAAMVVYMQAPRAKAADTGKKPKTIDFTLTDTNGKPVKLSDYRGKVVVLDIWATWCGFCVGEMPGLVQLQQDAIDNKKDLQFIGITIDRDHKAVTSYLKKHPVNYPIVFAENSVMKMFGDLPGVPVKFIIDKQGVMAERIVGAMEKSQLQKRLAKYLAAPAPPAATPSTTTPPENTPATPSNQ